MYYSMSFVPYRTLGGFLIHPSLYDLTTDRNTWEHWHLVPTERPSIAPPALKEHYVDIPGANGKIDLNQSLTGYPTYSNRTGSIEFAVLNGYRNWQNAYTDIMTTLHGKKMIMVYEEDPEYYYVGRWTVNQWKTEKTRSSITLDYDLEPYKWRLYDAARTWLWDPFNFKTGVIASRSIFYNTSASVSSGDNTTVLLNTQALMGDDTEDNFGSGKFDAQENLSNVIGNAPVSLTLSVYPDTDKTVSINFQNEELATNIRKDYNQTLVSYTDPDYLITNWFGANVIQINAYGYGRVNWNFRPGRL